MNFSLTMQHFVNNCIYFGINFEYFLPFHLLCLSFVSSRLTVLKINLCTLLCPQHIFVSLIRLLDGNTDLFTRLRSQLIKQVSNSFSTTFFPFIYVYSFYNTSQINLREDVCFPLSKVIIFNVFFFSFTQTKCK